MGFILFVGDGEAEKMDLCRGYDGCTPDAAANHISSVVGVLLQAPSFHQSSNKFEVVGYLFWKKGELGLALRFKPCSFVTTHKHLYLG